MENVNFNNGIAAEYDVSGGWTPAIAGFNVNLGVIRYGYVNEPPHTSIDTVELKGSVSHAVGPVVVGGAIFYTPDYFGTKGDGIYVEGNAAYHITPDLSVSGVLGRQTIDKGGDYTTWNMGVGYDITKNLALDARYYDTDGHQLGKFYNSHFVGSVKASF